MKLVKVKNSDGKVLIVQETLVPNGFQYVEDYIKKKEENSAESIKLPVSKLNRMKKQELQKILDKQGKQYTEKQTKVDLINLIIGEK
nr:hypothetical protein [Fredinandcohnia onubensis]